MKLSTRTEVKATQDVQLESALKAKLTERLAKLKVLDAEKRAAIARYDKEKANVDGFFEQAGANSITIEGHATITEVRGTSSKLDKMKFVQLGGSLAMLDEATTTTPKRPYVLVTFAKDDD